MTSLKHELPEFLHELATEHGQSSVDTLARAASLPALEPPTNGRERLLGSLPVGGRLWHFAEQVADLLDVPLARARQLLDDVDCSRMWESHIPGIANYWVEGGPRVKGALLGFVRVDAGHTFPAHEHLGLERVLILQGTCRDRATGEVFRPGDIAVMTEGSAHTIDVPADGVDLLKLAVAYNGVRIAGTVVPPRS